MTALGRAHRVGTAESGKNARDLEVEQRKRHLARLVDDVRSHLLVLVPEDDSERLRACARAEQERKLRVRAVGHRVGRHALERCAPPR